VVGAVRMVTAAALPREIVANVFLGQRLSDGQDNVYGALGVLSSSIEPRSIYLIGSSDLTQLYSTALAVHGYDASRVEGAAASRAGLAHVHRRVAAGGGA